MYSTIHGQICNWKWKTVIYCFLHLHLILNFIFIFLKMNTIMQTHVLCHDLCSFEDEDNNTFNYFQFLWLCYQLLCNVFQFQVLCILFYFENKRSTKYCNLIHRCISGLSNSRHFLNQFWNSTWHPGPQHKLSHSLVFFTGKFFSVERFKGIKYVLYLIFHVVVGVLYNKNSDSKILYISKHAWATS